MTKLKTMMQSTLVVVLMVMMSANVQAQAPELSDAEIASVAVVANKIDVNYAKIALKKSNNSVVREFANTMIKDHNKIIQLAVDLVTELHVTPKDNAVSQSLKKQAVKTEKMLNSKTGSDFDEAYVKNEVAYHGAVINAVKNVLIPQADNAQLKALLQTAAPILSTHLSHAKMTLKALQK